MKNKTGGQAFPKQQWEYDGQNNVLQYQEDGMTLRDYFAVKALSGWLASYPESCTHPIVAGSADEVAKHSYMLADAMLRAREAS
ncbi:hypothetical protein QPR61_14100 [Enterobacter hormaechei]|uniref:hypothetical protein n=1 Tax=Enterobacter hormaechei TaxID=158836 RepID=UPI0028528EAC|nr:hypothetical protein [Enterobacter hormaechei]WLZ67137.1 hypothetical protein QPR61_14100 [Enterobacter hormaechei]WLZ71834.1 hypothetical protein QPR72_14095 [Enterobacter hormaechei]WLZ78340.1 hypothetical protein QPR69_21975 [Enterobacter hormaechei]WLZ81724.1 hypothetical protein QPR80_14095 [Enterobacter hormaechei]